MLRARTSTAAARRAWPRVRPPCGSRPGSAPTPNRGTTGPASPGRWAWPRRPRPALLEAPPPSPYTGAEGLGHAVSPGHLRHGPLTKETGQGAAVGFARSVCSGPAPGGLQGGPRGPTEQRRPRGRLAAPPGPAAGPPRLPQGPPPGTRPAASGPERQAAEGHADVSAPLERRSKEHKYLAISAPSTPT